MYRGTHFQRGFEVRQEDGEEGCAQKKLSIPKKPSEWENWSVIYESSKVILPFFKKEKERERRNRTANEEWWYFFLPPPSQRFLKTLMRTLSLITKPQTTAAREKDLWLTCKTRQTHKSLLRERKKSLIFCFVFQCLHFLCAHGAFHISSLAFWRIKPPFWWIWLIEIFSFQKNYHCQSCVSLDSSTRHRKSSSNDHYWYYQRREMAYLLPLSPSLAVPNLLPNHVPGSQREIPLPDSKKKKKNTCKTQNETPCLLLGRNTLS